jgi:hypothetical protein
VVNSCLPCAVLYFLFVILAEYSLTKGVAYIYSLGQMTVSVTCDNKITSIYWYILDENNNLICISTPMTCKATREITADQTQYIMLFSGQSLYFSYIITKSGYVWVDLCSYLYSFDNLIDLIITIILSDSLQMLLIQLVVPDSKQNPTTDSNSSSNDLFEKENHVVPPSDNIQDLYYYVCLYTLAVTTSSNVLLYTKVMLGFICSFAQTIIPGICST